MPEKVKYHNLSEHQKKKYLGEFYTIISLLNSRDDVKKFMKDLLTLSETVMISRRIQIAKMLLAGGTYEEIRKELKVGRDNINQVEKWLNNGFGGYKKMIEKYQEKYGEKRKDWLTPFTKEWRRKKYSAHHLIFNLLDKE